MSTAKRLLPSAKIPVTHAPHDTASVSDIGLIHKPGPVQAENPQLLFQAQPIPATLSATPTILRTHYDSILFQLFVE